MIFFVAIAFSCAFIVTFAIGISTVFDAETHSKKTSHKLATIAQIQEAAERAVNERRMMMLDQTRNTPQVEAYRDVSIRAIDDLTEQISSDPQQLENVQALKNTLLYRYQIQDEQADGASHSAGQLTLNTSTVQQMSKATFDWETAVGRTRIHELNALFERDVARQALQWNVIYFMVTFMGISMGSTVFLIRYMIKELDSRRRIAEQIRNQVHITADGEPVLGRAEIEALLKVIEEGEVIKKGVLLGT